MSKRDRVPALLRLLFWSGEAYSEEDNKAILDGGKFCGESEIRQVVTIR